MYLSCGTRPDIAFIVGQLSRHNADPRVGHLRAVKRVVRYLKGTMHLGLVFQRGMIGTSPNGHKHPSPFGLLGYADSNFAGDPEDRKSVMGYCFFIAGAIKLWSSKRQRTVSTSTTKAEYIAYPRRARANVGASSDNNGAGANVAAGASDADANVPATASKKAIARANAAASDAKRADANVAATANETAIARANVTATADANETAKKKADRRAHANVATTANAIVTAKRRADANVTATANETTTARANVAVTADANETAKRRADANIAATANEMATGAIITAKRRAGRRARANVAVNEDANVATSASDANKTAKRRAQEREENANEPATNEEPKMIVREIVIYGDNERSIRLTKNVESQIRELVNGKELNIQWTCSANELADGFTKGLTVDTFKRHQSALGLAL